MNSYLATLREREVGIPCPNASILGDLSIPNDPRGLVIFAHGSGSSRFSPRNRMVAARLHDHQLATLLFDLMTPEEASSDWTAAMRFDIRFLTDRLVAVTRWIQQDESVRGLSIGYFGSSTGAAAALSAAALIPDIKAVVSRGGRTDLAGESVDWVEAPTLLIAGELDSPVIDWNRETFRRLDCPKEFTLVPGASHLFQEPGTLEEVADLAAAWFESHLSNKETGLPADHEHHTHAS